MILGVGLAIDFLRPGNAPQSPPADLASYFARWDGQHYKSIVDLGYSYHPGQASNVAFFPGYPLLGWAVKQILPVSTTVALLIVTHVALAGTFVILCSYAENLRDDRSPSAVEYALLAFGSYPVGFFLRMAYCEAFFCFLVALLFLGMRRHWPNFVLALLVGAATGTRPVGVALVPALLLHMWMQRSTWRNFLLQGALLLPLCCFGLLAYMAFQWYQFNEPLAFAKTQAHYTHHGPASSLEKAWSLITLEPVWGQVVPSSRHYWQRIERHNNPLFSLQLHNVFYVLLALGCMLLGAIKRWLTSPEWVASLLLVLIPYVTRGHEMSFSSMGRFTVVVLPMFLVGGRLLALLPTPARILLCSYGILLLAIYAALFAQGHFLI